MITHRGIIIKISTDDKVTVKITPDSSECSGCAINAMCKKSNEIEVPYPTPTNRLIGKEVYVGAHDGIRHKSILLFLAIPMLLLITTLALSYIIKVSDAMSSVIAISTVALWYILLYFLRARINNNAVFRIIK